MPKNKKAKASRKQTQRLRPAEIRGVPRIAPQVNKLTNASGPDTTAGLASALVRQLIDPCDSPEVPLPDGHSGKSEFVTTTTTRVMTIDAGGKTGFCIQNTPEETILQANAVWNAATPWDSQDDPQLAAMQADYAYIRPVAQCARIQFISALDQAPGRLLLACYPEPSSVQNTNADYQSVTGMVARMAQQQAKQFSPSQDIEVGWCPDNIQDFDSHVPGQNANLGQVNINDRELWYAPRIFGVITDSVSGAKVALTVVTRYQCFLLPAKNTRGKHAPVRDSRAMDALFSSIRSIDWVAIGDSIERTGTYAAKIGRLVGANPLLIKGASVVTKGLANVLRS